MANPRDITPSGRGLEEGSFTMPEPKPEVKVPDIGPRIGPTGSIGGLPEKTEEKPQKELDSPEEFRYTSVISSNKQFMYVNTTEGKRKYWGGTLAWRNNNPGNLKNTNFSKGQGSIGEDYRGHAVFPTYAVGKKAHYNLLFSGTTSYADLTVEQAVYRYAPSSDGNQPKNYLNYICKAASVAKTSRLAKLTEKQKEGMIQAMFVMEGFKKGTITNE